MDFEELCEPAGIRTQDPYIKSVMLYQLSYGILLRELFEPSSVSKVRRFCLFHLFHQLLRRDEVCLRELLNHFIDSKVRR